MDKKIEVKCECKGTGFIAVADNGGEGIEHVECAQHRPVSANGNGAGHCWLILGNDCWRDQLATDYRMPTARKASDEMMASTRPLSWGRFLPLWESLPEADRKLSLSTLEGSFKLMYKGKEVAN